MQMEILKLLAAQAQYPNPAENMLLAGFGLMALVAVITVVKILVMYIRSGRENSGETEETPVRFEEIPDYPIAKERFDGAPLLTNKDVHRIVRNEFDGFFGEQGFVRRKGSTMWIRQTDDAVLFIELFYPHGQECFDFDIGVMPLCIPADHIYPYISARLRSFDSFGVYHSLGSYIEARLRRDIELGKSIFLRDVFGKLQKDFSDCKGLTAFMDSGEAWHKFHISPFDRSRYKAFLYYCGGDIENGDIRAGDFLRQAEQYEDRAADEIAEMREIMRIARSGSEELQGYFARVREKNISAWELP